MGTHSWPPYGAHHLSYHPHTFKGEDGCAEEQQESLPACNQRQAAVTWDLLKDRKGVGVAVGRSSWIMSNNSVNSTIT